MQQYRRNNLPLFKNILKDVQKSIKAWDGKMYIVYLPGYESLIEKMSDVERGRLFRRKEVMEMFKSLDLPIIDGYLAFRKSEDPLSYYPFRLNFHFNEQGYRLLAETIIPVISAEFIRMENQ